MTDFPFENDIFNNSQYNYFEILCEIISKERKIILYHIEYDNYLLESVIDLESKYHNLGKHINNMLNI